MLYFTDHIYKAQRYRSFFNSLCDGAAHLDLIIFIEGGSDIWLRDFLPIKVGKDKYIQYIYDPDYLKDFPHLRTVPGPICESLGLDTIKTDIILDGGNVILSEDYLIMTDKVILENRHQYSRKKLLRELHELFEVEKVVLIGWDPKDIYGHADGMVRFIDERTVLLSDIYAMDAAVTEPLKEAGLEYEVLEFRKKNRSKRRWAYLNFLHTLQVFLLPKLNIPEDDMALEQMAYYYPDYAQEKRMAQVDSTSLIRRGGALNCVCYDMDEFI